MTLRYNAKTIEIDLDQQTLSSNTLVYAHPGDKIKFSSGIEYLHKEIIRGDLVIHLVSGKTLTIVNFGIMALDGVQPVLVDPNKEYNDPFALFGGVAYHDDNNNSHYVISRKLSGPDSTLTAGTEIPSAQDLAEGQDSSLRKVGNYITSEQNLVAEFGPMYKPYQVRTFMHAHNKLYDVPVIYTTNYHFRHNNPNSDNFPVKLIVINPKITGEYGNADAEVDRGNQKNGSAPMYMMYGGGRQEGPENTFYMYTRTDKDLTHLDGSLYYDGMNNYENKYASAHGMHPIYNNKIVRTIKVSLDNSLVHIEQIIIRGLPADVTLDNGSDTGITIKHKGGGYTVDVKSPQKDGAVYLNLVYDINLGAYKPSTNGIELSYSGFHVKTNDRVRGSASYTFDFRPVHNEGDLLDGTRVNTYTFSSTPDPLKLHFSDVGHVVKGGKADYIYVLGNGNNKLYSGESKEEFVMGSGHNNFYAGFSASDNVHSTSEVPANQVKNELFLGTMLEKYIDDSHDTSLSNLNMKLESDGSFTYSGTYHAKHFESVFKNFAVIHFNQGEKGNLQSPISQHLDIASTNVSNPLLLDFGYGGNHEVYLTNASSSGVAIGVGQFKLLPDPKSTHDNHFLYIKYKGEANPNNIYLGYHGQATLKIFGTEKGNDVFYGYNMGPAAVWFDARGGNNRADFGAVTSGLTYDASTRIAKDDVSVITLLNVNTIIASKGHTKFLGAAKGSMNYVGNNKDTILTYAHVANVPGFTGTIVDLQEHTVAKKFGDTIRGTDHFSNVTKFEASNYDDTFKMTATSSVAQHLDGLKGNNTVDYSRSMDELVFDMSQSNDGSIVQRGAAGVADVLVHFREFIGSTQASTKFIVNGFIPEGYNKDAPQEYRFKFKGGSGQDDVNSISYLHASFKDAPSAYMQLDLTKISATTPTIEACIYNKDTFLAKDLLEHIKNFTLLANTKNTVFFSNKDQLALFAIDGGAHGQNTISFERASSGIEINFVSLKTKLTNFQHFVGSKFDDTFNIGKNVFANELLGGGGHDTLIMDSIVNSGNYTYHLGNMQLEGVKTTRGNLGLFGFANIKSGRGQDIYKIEYKIPKDHTKISDVVHNHIMIDGGSNSNTLDFGGIVKEDSADKSGLDIDLSNALSINISLHGDHQVLMHAQHFRTIKGSAYNDTFILPVVEDAHNLTYYIDGAGGDANEVSYEAYLHSINITTDIIDRFKNIQKIKGSKKDSDQVSLTEDSALQVDGNGGSENIAIYRKVFTADVNITYTDKNIEIDKKGGKKDVLEHIQVLDFSRAVGIDKHSINLTIKNDNNFNIRSDGELFIKFSPKTNSHVDYSFLNTTINVELHVYAGVLSATNGRWIAVHKGADKAVSGGAGRISTDYLCGINNIKLSNAHSTVSIDNTIEAMSNEFGAFNITGVNKHNDLDLSKYSGIVNIDLRTSKGQQQVLKLGKMQVNFSNIDTFITSISNGSIYKIIAAEDKNYTIKGNNSQNTLDYSHNSKALTINVEKPSAGNGSNIFYKVIKGATTDTVENVTTIIGTSKNDSLNINYSAHAGLTLKESGGNNTVSYEKMHSSDSLNVNISSTKVTATRGGGLYLDKLEHVNTIIGQDTANNRFAFAGGTTGTFHVKAPGNTSGYNQLDLVHINSDVKISYNKATNTLDVESTGLKVDARGFSTIRGSDTATNNFVFGDLFSNDQKYIAAGTRLFIIGNTSGHDNVLDLSSTSVDLHLEPLTGLISARDGSKHNEYISISTRSGIQKILLGSGNDTIELDSATKDFPGGWKVIDGGGGVNSVSFSHSLTAIDYDLSKGLESANLTLIHFSGVAGGRGADTFYLKRDKEEYTVNGKHVDKGKPGISVDGNIGDHNTLDYSDLQHKVIVDIPNHAVYRLADLQESERIVDDVLNLQYFKTGVGGADFYGDTRQQMHFIGDKQAVSKNTLSYAHVTKAQSMNFIFNFFANEVVKNATDVKDRFENISSFVGAKGAIANLFRFSDEYVDKFHLAQITITGGENSSNRVDLGSMRTSVTYEFSKDYNSFSGVTDKGVHYRVELHNISQFIGSGKGDTFKFSDDMATKLLVDAGMGASGVVSTIDMSSLQESVTIDFHAKSIKFGDHLENYLHVNKFIGSNKGGNKFLNLDGIARYIVDGGNGENNIVDYGACNVGINVFVKDGNVHVSKGSFEDELSHIQKLVLSKNSNTLILSSALDVARISKFQAIEARAESNSTMIFKGDLVASDLTIDLNTYKVNSFALHVKGFTNYIFQADGTTNVKHTLILANGDLKSSLNSVTFAKTNSQNILDFTHVTSDLLINAADEQHLKIYSRDAASSRAQVNYATNLKLGNHNYDFSYVKFNLGSNAGFYTLPDSYTGKISIKVHELQNVDHITLDANGNYILSSGSHKSTLSAVNRFIVEGISGDNTDDFHVSIDSLQFLSSNGRELKISHLEKAEDKITLDLQKVTQLTTIEFGLGGQLLLNGKGGVVLSTHTLEIDVPNSTGSDVEIIVDSLSGAQKTIKASDNSQKFKLNLSKLSSGTSNSIALDIIKARIYSVTSPDKNLVSFLHKDGSASNDSLTAVYLPTGQMKALFDVSLRDTSSSRNMDIIQPSSGVSQLSFNVTNTVSLGKDSSGLTFMVALDGSKALLRATTSTTNEDNISTVHIYNESGGKTPSFHELNFVGSGKDDIATFSKVVISMNVFIDHINLGNGALFYKPDAETEYDKVPTFTFNLISATYVTTAINFSDGGVDGNITTEMGTSLLARLNTVGVSTDHNFSTKLEFKIDSTIKDFNFNVRAPEEFLQSAKGKDGVAYNLNFALPTISDSRGASYNFNFSSAPGKISSAPGKMYENSAEKGFGHYVFSYNQGCLSDVLSLDIPRDVNYKNRHEYMVESTLESVIAIQNISLARPSSLNFSFSPAKILDVFGSVKEDPNWSSYSSAIYYYKEVPDFSGSISIADLNSLEAEGRDALAYHRASEVKMIKNLDRFFANSKDHTLNKEMCHYFGTEYFFDSDFTKSSDLNATFFANSNNSFQLSGSGVDDKVTYYGGQLFTLDEHFSKISIKDIEGTQQFWIQDVRTGSDSEHHPYEISYRGGKASTTTKEFDYVFGADSTSSHNATVVQFVTDYGSDKFYGGINTGTSITYLSNEANIVSFYVASSFKDAEERPLDPGFLNGIQGPGDIHSHSRAIIQGTSNLDQVVIQDKADQLACRHVYFYDHDYLGFAPLRDFDYYNHQGSQWVVLPFETHGVYDILMRGTDHNGSKYDSKTGYQHNGTLGYFVLGNVGVNGYYHIGFDPNNDPSNESHYQDYKLWLDHRCDTTSMDMAFSAGSLNVSQYARPVGKEPGVGHDMLSFDWKFGTLTISEDYKEIPSHTLNITFTQAMVEYAKNHGINDLHINIHLRGKEGSVKSDAVTFIIPKSWEDTFANHSGSNNNEYKFNIDGLNFDISADHSIRGKYLHSYYTYDMHFSNPHGRVQWWLKGEEAIHKREVDRKERTEQQHNRAESKQQWGEHVAKGHYANQNEHDYWQNFEKQFSHSGSNHGHSHENLNAQTAVKGSSVSEVRHYNNAKQDSVHSSSTWHGNSLDLHSLLNAAKEHSSSGAFHQETLAHTKELSLHNVPHELLKASYHHNESESLSYLLDGHSNNSSFNNEDHNQTLHAKHHKQQH